MSKVINVVVIILFFAACSPNNVEVDNSLKKHFDAQKADGTFAIYNNASGNFTVYNLSRYKDSTYLPASTFKIINSLIGIETGRVSDEKMVIKWDGIERGRQECNKDLTMEEAFKVSCVPYYQEVARRIGKDTMQQWLDTLGYGSRYKKISVNKIDSFWLDNSVKVTADEQLGLMKKLFFDQLPFQKRTMRIVKDMMVMEKNANYTMGYKTGWGHRENGNSIGWVVGWIEENRHPYFYVLNLEGDKNMNMPEVRMKLLKDILVQLGYMQGKM